MQRRIPGKLNYGSSGTGGSVHLTVEYLSQMAGISMTHVPYKGQGPCVDRRRPAARSRSSPAAR